MMKKRVFGILFSFALMLTMMPVLGMSQMAHAEDVEEYPLWVGGTQVTSENASDIPAKDGDTKSGKASYDAERGILTLDNYSYTGEGYSTNRNSNGIYSSENNLTIQLIGTNTLTNTIPNKTSLGISCKNLIITGSGVLIANGSDTSNGTSTGIQADQLTIGSNATVKANGGRSAFESEGIYATGVIVNGTLEATGGALPDSYGVCISSISSDSVDVASGCTFIATGKTRAINGKVKNAITGTGWTNVEGTEGKKTIEIAGTGRKLNDLKKVHFPEVVDVTGVTLNKESTTLTAGDIETLIATIEPEDATLTDLDWGSSDVSVATVDGSGEVTAVAKGTATITVKSLYYPDKTATCTVTVKEKAAPIPVGSVHKVAGSKYVVTSASTVSLKKAKSKKTFTLPATVKIEGKTFKVTSVKKKAFKGTKVKTLTIKSKKLTKKAVRNSLKGSKVKTVKVKVGNKKTNKKYVKKYKKIFTKKNCGKKVRVII